MEVAVPGEKLVANRKPDAHHAYTDVYIAIRDAFDAMRRQLEDYSRALHGRLKAHERLSRGRIIELTPDEDYGRIEGLDGRLVYFHRNSVVDAAFDDLQGGTGVRYVEEMGERGPQASIVHVVGKHPDVG